MLEQNVAEGIHRVEDAHTNWYLVEEDGALTVVDCGVPTSWESLEAALGTLGRSKSDVKAIVLTHAHFDHIGFAERARQELRVPVLVHENDVPLTRHPTQYAHERSPLAYVATRPKALPVILGFVKTRAFFPRPIGAVERYTGGELDVPGHPHVVFTPGHTLGHCSLHFPDRDVLIAGDAVVTFNPYTGEPGAADRRGGRERRLGAGAALARRGRGDGREDGAHRPRRALARRRRGDRGGSAARRDQLNGRRRGPARGRAAARGGAMSR